MSTAMRHTAMSLEQATRIFYLLNFTRWFPVGFVVGIFILIQTGRGLTIAQAMTAAAVSGFACFALELPTSGFADAFGRRAVYLAAAVVNVLAGAAYLFAQNFWQFVGAAALMGTFRALDSGPLEAWFVDTVHEGSPGADVDQELSRAGTVLGLAVGAGALISGGLIWWHPVRAFAAIDLAVAVFALLNVVHLAATWLLLREGPRAISTGEQERRAWASAREAPAVIASGVRLLATNKVLLGIILAEIAWSIGMVAFESMLPLRLEELLGSAQAAGATMGPVAAVGWGIFALGTWIAGKASKRWGVARAAMLGRTLNATGVLLMAWAFTPAGLIAAYLFTYTWHGVNGPPHSALLHREAEARNRATVLSINSMFAFLAFGVAGPLAGLLADRASIRLAMLAVGVTSLLGVAAYLPARHAECAVKS
ncbi:MAG TPA: MFS transporter [Tetrasphaera sp.]|uniref:MFS transporter n=1 Tax=Nostocoides sp. TaxID=1917966 RepID=UPI002CA46830|nr:MFS transporter [Tetrasphaera sp.]HNQ07887.1 MFS transporter [Tetrasphaera sp.]